MFIDTHCHILPGLDDGAESINDACEMIEQAYNGGTTIMVATPHYMNRAQCTEINNKESILSTYKLVKEEIKRRDIPVQLFLGSELLGGTDVGELYSENRLITINNSRYILVEFMFEEDIYHVDFCIKNLVSCGLVPVIAHPERYMFLRDYPQKIYSFLELGCKLQINKGSVLGKYGGHAMRYSKWLLMNDMVHVIASDCHDTAGRTSDMGDIYQWMVTRFSQKHISMLMHDNPKKILLDQAF